MRPKRSSTTPEPASGRRLRKDTTSYGRRRRWRRWWWRERTMPPREPNDAAPPPPPPQVVQLSARDPPGTRCEVDLFRMRDTTQQNFFLELHDVVSCWLNGTRSGRNYRQQYAFRCGTYPARGNSRCPTQSYRCPGISRHWDCNNEVCSRARGGTTRGCSTDSHSWSRCACSGCFLSGSPWAKWPPSSPSSTAWALPQPISALLLCLCDTAGLCKHVWKYNLEFLYPRRFAMVGMPTISLEPNVPLFQGLTKVVKEVAPRMIIRVLEERKQKWAESGLIR